MRGNPIQGAAYRYTWLLVGMAGLRFDSRWRRQIQTHNLARSGEGPLPTLGFSTNHLLFPLSASAMSR